MHSVPLLINITLALVVAFIGGTLARRIGLPSIVGYLLAGIAIGPFTPGIVGDVTTIQQLAELGVIFLMFGVGLHFSFQDLWRVRDIAIPGALIQTLIATLFGYGLSQFWGWSAASGFVLGLSISVASTVVLLRGLMDHSLLNTPHGQAAIGWLVMEDILSVFILVLMPSLVPSTRGFDWLGLGITLLKAVAFVAVMFLVGTRLIPWLLTRAALTRSRELFILAILAISLGTALGAAELFGVSLALGAFVAGAIVSQSHLSHQVGADISPFQEAFSVIFFVSVGMLVDPAFLVKNIGPILALTVLVVIGKFLIVLLMGLVFPRPAKTFLVIAVGLSQVGEFSFILGQSGLSLHLFDTNQYSLILATSLISITMNPLMFHYLPTFEKWIRKSRPVWRQLDTHREIPVPVTDDLSDHVVIIGYGRTGKQLAGLLKSLNTPFIVVESDMELIETVNAENVPTLFGDAANSEVITHAGLNRAKVLVITTPEETTSTLIVSAVHAINPKLPIITRAATKEGVQALAQLGAQHIIQPELEVSLEMIYNTLLLIGYELREVHDFVDEIREEHYVPSLVESQHPSFRQLLHAADRVQITWLSLPENSPLIGKTLRESNIRARTGASVVAIIRQKQVIANPKSITAFEQGDQIGFIGEESQIQSLENLIHGHGREPGIDASEVI